MPGANISGISFSPTPRCEPAPLGNQQLKTAAPNCNATRRLMIDSRDRGASCQKMSRVETIIPRISARNSMIATLAGTATQYHYFRTTRVGRKSENCCSYCGNPAPFILEVFRNPLISKDLELFQNGPRLANRMLPAQVRLYWCPET
jgi:hypothetical protein